MKLEQGLVAQVVQLSTFKHNSCKILQALFTKIDHHAWCEIHYFLFFFDTYLRPMIFIRQSQKDLFKKSLRYPTAPVYCSFLWSMENPLFPHSSPWDIFYQKKKTDDDHTPAKHIFTRNKYFTPPQPMHRYNTIRHNDNTPCMSSGRFRRLLGKNRQRAGTATTPKYTYIFSLLLRRGENVKVSHSILSQVSSSTRLTVASRAGNTRISIVGVKFDRAKKGRIAGGRIEFVRVDISFIKRLSIV